nr:hypothetical protein [Haloplanus sp. XH21]
MAVGPDEPSVSDDTPDRPPVAGLLDALRVRRNATIGAVAGVVLAGLGYLVRVFELIGPVAGTQSYPVVGPEGWYLLLSVVLASATALLVTTLLTAATAYRLVGRQQGE